MKKLVIILIMITEVAQSQTSIYNPPRISQQVWSLTEVMYHDVVNPPAAARFYAYSLLAGYEILSQIDSNRTLTHKGFPQFLIIKPNDLKKIDKELAVMYGILEAGRNIIPSGYLLEEKQNELLRNFSKIKSKAVIDNSVAFAKRVAQQVIQYSRTDGYFNLSTRLRYTPKDGDDAWRPTPPEYMGAVEPHWRTVRTFFLDSVQQFRPLPATVFEKNSSSAFYKLMLEVYDISRTLSEEQKLIANFWDCNPFAVQFQGHMSIGLKKISPGGHWMGITGIACAKADLSFEKELFLQTLVALTLHDAFTSCWDEKYRSNRIRPETAINRYIDEKWKPFLQTPPFPEYSSGHSVISTAVSEVLTYFLGDKFTFIDTVETYIGLPSRKFYSFREAAAEARISRLYGGIHFRDAIENGGEQGRRIGEFVIRKIRMNVSGF